MVEKRRIDPITYIFDIGLKWVLTPCYVEWLSKILRYGYWKLRPVLFVGEIIEEMKNDRGLRTVYSCGYYECLHSYCIGFKNVDIRDGYHQNLHQVVHCLNEYRGIPFEKIDVEQWFGDKYRVDVRGKINPEKYILVELGTLSPFEKFWLIYNPKVEELWFDGVPFDGKRKCFYSLSSNKKVSMNEVCRLLIDTMHDYYRKKCRENPTQFSNCSIYSKELCICHQL